MKKDNKKFRILIVEDEILIADSIKKYLIAQGHTVVGIAISYQEATQLYTQENPDIALLDIRLNGRKTGIDFAYFLQNKSHSIPFIFLTSQLDVKSISDAKETFPSGYLSKPIQKESLYTTIEIAMHSHHSKNAGAPAVTLNDGTSKFLVPLRNILYFEAKHIYVKVYVAEGNVIRQRSSLKELLALLPQGQFIQTHRSYAINVNHVTRWDSQYLYVSGHAIPISRSQRKAVIAQLSVG